MHRYAQRTHRMTSSAIRELLKLTTRPDVISFAGGLPAPELFPIEEFRAAADSVLSKQGRQALQYSTTEGYPPLREMIVRHMARYGIIVDTENVLITTGSQEALDLVGKVLINPGDRILTEEPTYLGAIQAFTMYGADYVTVPIDADGLQTSLLEEALRSGPKFMYILPNFQNPAGTTLPLDRRLDLTAMAGRYGIPIIEDDPYGQLRYEGDHIKPLVVLDAEAQHCEKSGHYTGNVIYLSTFSKTLAPGLRLGWVVAPKDVIARLVQAKQGTDLHTSTLDQMIAYEVARGGFIDQHVRPSATCIAGAATSCSPPSSARSPTPLPACAGRGRRAGCSCGSWCPSGSTPPWCWRTRCGNGWRSSPARRSTPWAAGGTRCGSTSATPPIP
jgi:2-aminoadipate transaminase